MVLLRRFATICGASALGALALGLLALPLAALVDRSASAVPEELVLDRPPERSYVTDAHGNVLASLFFEQNRRSVPLAEIPEAVSASVLAVEDAHFYTHDGVNLRATLRAMLANVESASIAQGGSTITMQLVKNLVGRSEQTLSRKSREAVLAQRLEQQLTKDEILERYLNTVYFGNGAYGVQAAAETYWGKDVAELGWAEGALLAAVIRDPNGYEPFRNPTLAAERRRIALDRLVDVGRLTEDEAARHAFVPVPTTSHSKFDAGSTEAVVDQVTKYFTDEVTRQLLNDPAYGLGDTYQARFAALYQGGIKVETTLDPDLQRAAVEARADQLPGDDTSGLFTIRGRKPDVEAACPKLNEDGWCQGTVAMVSVEPSTGAVRMMVGGPGHDRMQYNAATGGNGRQVGSSMKTLVLAAAMEAGHSVLDSVNGGTCALRNPGGIPDPYKPAGRTTGWAPLTRQLAGSINCAFVRLGRIVGGEAVVALSRKLGITAPLDADALSLPLGSADITPLQMAGAYAAFANDGVFNQPYLVERITTSSGQVLYQHQRSAKRALSIESARQTTMALQAVVTGGTGTAARIPGRPTAGKTGTTDRSGDAWFVGYTPELSTAVWMGSPESVVPLASVGGIDVSGGTFPTRIWRAFTAAALDGREVTEFGEVKPAAGRSLQMPRDSEVVTARPPGSTTTTAKGATTTTAKGATTTTARTSSTGPKPASSAPAPTQP